MSEADLNKQIRSFLNSAFRSIHTRDYNEALRELKAAEVLDRQNPEILYNIGITYSRMGLHKTAVEYFDRVVQLPRTFIDIAMVKKLLAFSHINLGSYNMALGILDPIINNNHDDDTSLSMKAYCLEKSGKLDEAMKIYRFVIKKNPASTSAYNSLAYLIAETGGDLDTALKLGEQALKREPENPYYLDTVGYIHLKRGDYDKAGEYLARAIEKYPLSEEIKGHYLMARKKQTS